jgi:hypothetical protein
MALEPLSPAAFAFIVQVEGICTCLLGSARPESHLGGKLLYAGALDESGRAFTVAANIAGAATLAASDDPAAARQAMRDGVVDFLVNSLDEALRVLKNQVRKRETVAVCVSLAPGAVEDEMRARGVVPDLSFSREFHGALARFDEPHTRLAHAYHESHQGSPRELEREEDEKTWLTWRAASSPALWLPKLDALALDCLAPQETVARRWLERAPRCLGRLTENIRTLRVPAPTVNEILGRFRAAVASGEIPIAVEINIGPWTDSSSQSLVPNP